MRNFQDGFVLCYLLHYCNPDLIDLNSLKRVRIYFYLFANFAKILFLGE